MSKIVYIRSVVGIDKALAEAEGYADTHEVKAFQQSGDVIVIIMQEYKDGATDNKVRSTSGKAAPATKPAKQVRSVRSKPDAKGSGKGKDKAEVQSVS